MRVQTPDGRIRIARQLGSQGCVILAENGKQIGFKPVKVEPNLPARSGPWPMGDQLPAKNPVGYDAAKVEAALASAFAPEESLTPIPVRGTNKLYTLASAFAPEESLTQAFVVTWKGQIIGERYGLDANAETPLEGWSMGKSVVASLLGVLIQRGVYSLDQPSPIPEWQTPGDPRQAIRIRDLMQMSSGLRIRAQQDPEYADDGRLPDHWD